MRWVLPIDGHITAAGLLLVCWRHNRESVRHDLKRDWQGPDWLAIDLSVHRFAPGSFANRFRCLPRLDFFPIAERAEPDRWQTREITQAAALGIREELEGVFKEAGPVVILNGPP